MNPEDELDQFKTFEEKASFVEGRLAALTGFGNKKMGRKSQEKYKELMDAMKMYTMPSSKINYNAGPYMPPNMQNYYDAMPQQRNSLVVFFGFNGMLSQKYSVVDGMGREEIMARLQFAGDKVPYSIKQYNDFMVVVDQMRDTPNMLKEITFDDALITLRVGIDKLQVVEFEDAEEDEFNDNCVETCRPGDHKCGKK